MSCDDGLGGVQGFIDTHAEEALEAEAWAEPPPARFLFEDNKYKLHACCHGTHAMLDALAELRRQHDFRPDQVERIELRTNPRWLRVCDIKRPRTALEVKFSYGLLAAMALTGIDTAVDRAYVDALCGDPALVDVAGRVSVEGDASVGDLAAEVTVILRDGEPIRIAHDLAAPLPVEVLVRGLRAKAEALLGPDRAERMWAATRALETRSAADLGALLRG